MRDGFAKWAPVAVPADRGPPGSWVARHGLAPGGALLDAGGPTEPPARFAALALDPVEVLTWSPGEPAPAGGPLAALEAMVGRAAHPGFADLPGPRPFVVCALAYDLGRTIERLPAVAADPRHLSDLWAARYDATYVWDRSAGRGAVLAVDPEAAARLLARLDVPPSPPPPLRAGPARALATEAEHAAALARIQAHIAAGDVYQVNHTVRFAAELDRAGDPTPLFTRLHARTPAPFAAALRLDARRCILSVSPERFLRWDADGRVETRPIKGTRPRGGTAAEDADLAAELRESAKDRAEHVMIVDLERNDLGRVCRTGTVRPTRLFDLEVHPTVHHLVSVVEGRLEPGVGLAALLRATFPGGSITGAPKIRAMEVIEGLEPERRGIYCGAIGYLDPAGGGDLNVAIRTAWVVDRAVWYQAGGGIVADSDPREEWAEALAKARAFVAACADDGAP